MPIASDTDDRCIDFITGRTMPNTGAEANRQRIERLLVEEKGYPKTDIEVDAPIALAMGAEMYRSSVDLVVRAGGRRCMVIKCAPGSLASREREAVAAARLLDAYQIPLAVASDGQTAIVWDTISGKQIGEDLSAIPTRSQAETLFSSLAPQRLEEARRTRQQLIFRSYDCMNVNRKTP
ncbi:MAG: type I restriction enzyme HsdR N-terminal domain-containing protein [Desulfobacterales bacterium]|nr:type I restriction enzyme HsdR N-terminal domain-containing protein [Desulfobacterales bacterium]